MLVLLIASCIVCTHTDAWERFEGATLFTGVDSLHVSGDTTFAWNGGGASIHRVAAMAATDGYWIELRGPGAYYSLGLRTVSRPHAGTFRVVRQRDDHTSRGDLYTAIMGWSNAMSASSDSGWVKLTTAGTGYDGECLVYLSDPYPRVATMRHFVVRGTFHLRKED